MAKSVVVSKYGPECVRCGYNCVVLKHKVITPKLLRQPFYYSQWYRCDNPRCKTTLIMLEKFKVFPDDKPTPEKSRLEQRRRQERAVGNMQSVSGLRPPWEE